MVRVVWHNHKEDESRFRSCLNMRCDSAVVVELDALGEGFEKFVFVLSCPVLNEADVGVLYKDVKALLDAHVIELFVDITSILLITL